MESKQNASFKREQKKREAKVTLTHVENKINSAVQEIKWLKKQVEHNTGTANKLGYSIEAKHLQTVRELYEDIIFRLENITDYIKTETNA